jgi:hypothetical protein
MAAQESDDQRSGADAVNRHTARVGAYTLPGSGFQRDRQRVFGPVILYVVPLFCLLTAVMSRSLQAAVVGLIILVGLLLLQDRWGLRRRAPWLGSEHKATAMLGWAVLLGLSVAALWATSVQH